LTASPVTATTLVEASAEKPGGRSRVAGSPSSMDVDELSAAAAAFD